MVTLVNRCGVNQGLGLGLPHVENNTDWNDDELLH